MAALNGLIDIFQTIWNFFVDTFKALVSLVEALIMIGGAAGQLSMWMPAFLATMALISVAIIIILRVVGRS